MEKIFTRIMTVVLFVLLGLLFYLVGDLALSYYDNSIEIVEKVEVVDDEKDNKKDVILPEIEASETVDSELIKEDNIYKEEQKKDEIINILLVGVDTRSYDFNSRSDSMILLSYNKTDHIVKMVSFLRDTWVYLPDRGYSRINNATAYGGVGLLINTLNENFDLDIQNYVQVRFEDFKEVIDILGGLDVELSQSEIDYINWKLHEEDKDWKNDVVAKPGVVHLNGVQTLWHCRNRNIGSGDFTRTDRQREVLSLLIDKALNMSMVELTQLLYELKDSVDMNIPLESLIIIANDALISKNITIESYRIPFDGMYHYANKNGASVLEIDMDKTVEELHNILGFAEEVEE